MNYLLHLFVPICLYVILTQSLNLVVGYGGLFSLCHAAFYGLGAYISTLLIVKLGWPFLGALPAAVASPALLALLVAFSCSRLRGDFFVLGTLGFQMIIFAVLYNWTDLTQGPSGISGIPRPEILGWAAHSIAAFLVLAVLAAVLVLGFHWRLASIPFGRTLQAIRDDELAAKALSKNALWFKAVAFMVAGGIAAIAGSLYAGYTTSIDPTSFALSESIFILAAVVVGGAGNLRGPVIGAVFMVLLPEALRFLHVSDIAAPTVRQIVYGILLILMMRVRPQGIMGQYAFD